MTQMKKPQMTPINADRFGIVLTSILWLAPWALRDGRPTGRSPYQADPSGPHVAPADFAWAGNAAIRPVKSQLPDQSSRRRRLRRWKKPQMTPINADRFGIVFTSILGLAPWALRDGRPTGRSPYQANPSGPHVAPADWPGRGMRPCDRSRSSGQFKVRVAADYADERSRR